MKKTALLLFLCILIPTALWGASRSDNLKKAAEKVWATDAPGFDAYTAIPDSLTENASAVIISRHIDVNSKIDFRSNIQLITGGWSFTVFSELERVMVKILDMSAVEYYSTFSFDERKQVKYLYYSILTVDEFFGARIHKPDGRVEQVDVDESYSVADGKKGKDKKENVIAIPGLEVGDVLEYFYLTESQMRELSIPPFSIQLCKRYPTMNFFFEGVFGSDLTVEFRTYNGAPIPQGGVNDKGANILSLHLRNIIGTEESRYFNQARQYPFITFNVLNNNSQMAYIPATARPKGVRGNLPTGTIYRDIAAWYSSTNLDSKIIDRAIGRIKNYSKQHPDATPRQKTDYAWYALLYEGIIDKKETYSDRDFAKYFATLMRRLKYYPESSVGLGFINSRFDVPTNQISSWSEPNYVTFVADTIYSVCGIPTCVPGELPGRFQGEVGGAYTGDPKKLTTTPLVKEFTIPVTSARSNEFFSEAHTTIQPDMTHLELKRKVTSKGASKNRLVDLISHLNFIALIEEYLEVPDSKRIKSKTDSIGFNNDIRSFLMDEAEDNLGIRPDSILSFTIGSCGLVPDQPSIQFSTTSTIDGLITEGGDDIILSVGKLFGDYPHVAERDRTSINDAYFESTEMTRYMLTVDIPQGYTVDEAALAALQANLANPVGQFFAQTTVDNEARTVNLQVVRRINSPVVSVDYRSPLMDIDEACAAFNEGVLVFTRAK